MTFYHGSPTAGLKVLQPKKPQYSHKPTKVYLTTLLPMALLYTVQNYEYTYGYTKEDTLYFEEYFPNALEVLYRGKSASLYVCTPESVEATKIPKEAVSDSPVPVLQEIRIPDAWEALLEQEQLGTLVIRRYNELSAEALQWIRQAEADTIRESDLIRTPGPRADYYREHYPESWALVESTAKTHNT